MSRTRNTKKKTYNKSEQTNSAESKNQETSQDATTNNNENTKDSGPKINDPEWYSRDPQLLIDSASLSYADPLGRGLELASSAQNFTPNVKYTSSRTGKTALPGILVGNVKHTIGDSRDRKSPANVSAQALYTHVRYVNSGRKNYDPADLYMYALTVGDLQAFVAWCKRTYAFAFMYSQLNQYIGKDLLEALGVSSSDIINNLANFRYWLNAYINKIASFVLPKDIPYFNRRKFMYDGLYLENPYGNLKDQLYLFNPVGFFKFQLDTIGKGMLAFTPINPSDSKLTFANIREYGEDLIANIMGDEDFGLMCGDILKAYGTEGILALDGLPEEYYVLPHYDMTVLSQFKNASIVPSALCQFSPASTPFSRYKSHTDDGSEGGPYWYKYGDVYQDTHGNLLCREGMAWEAASSAPNFSPIPLSISRPLTVEVPVPGPADNIEASRLMVSCGTGLTVPESGYVQVGGTNAALNIELSTGLDFFMSVVAYRTRDDVVQKFNMSGYQFSKTSDNWSDTAWIMSQFKYAPTVYGIEYTEGSSGITINSLYPVSNVDNYCVVDGAIISKMHECALLSLFYVPGVAKLVNYITK